MKKTLIDTVFLIQFSVNSVASVAKNSVAKNEKQL